MVDAALAETAIDLIGRIGGRVLDHLLPDRRLRISASGRALLDEVQRMRVTAQLELWEHLTDPETLLAPAPSGEGDLTGMAAAPGTVTGTARVILDPADANVQPGEILVAPSTDPGWTPLFLTAGGLVTETGSPVSHGPTVAREYGIPAVIGIEAATRVIHTGQRITVNGSTGAVERHDHVDRVTTESADGAPSR